MSKKVLIIRLTALGDVIFTLPLVNVLKSSGYSVGFLTSEKGIGVIQGNPSVDKVYFFPLAKWRKNAFSTIKDFWKLVFEIRREGYDIALDCQQMFKSLYLFLLCGAKRRITFKDAKELSFLGATEFVTPKHSFKSPDYHIVERNLDFARYLGLNPEEPVFSLPPVDESVETKVSDLLKACDKPIVVVAPATTWKNKHWHNQNWIELIDSISADYSLVFTGMECDKPLISSIGGDKYLNLAGQTNVDELKAVISRADIVITPDSGTAHLAWTLQKPKVIALFTCTPPKRFGPYSNLKINKYFSVSGGNLPCQPCFKRKCKLKTDECSMYPSVETVLEIFNRL